jgi:hypothetical protein
MVPQISFQSLLWAFAKNQGENPDPAVSAQQGGSVAVSGAISAGNLSAWAHFLNDAVRWCWHPDPELPETPWPYTVASGSITPSAGVISYDQVSGADWWRVWSADPRPYASPPTAFPIASTADNAGIYPRTAASSVFVFWRPYRPVFSYNVFISGQTYPAGTYVYDPQVILTGTTSNTSATVSMTSTTGLQAGMAVTGTGIAANVTISSLVANTSVTLSSAATASGTNPLTFGTGHTFLSIISAAGSAIMDTTKWTPQTVPDPLVKIILAKAEAYRIRSKGNDPKLADEEADKLLAAEKLRALPVAGSPPPWSFDLAA